MKKITFIEPAMCCSTGVCGPSVNPELLRVSTMLDLLAKKGVTVERFNLSTLPQAFVENKEISKLLQEKGLEALPAIYVDGELKQTGGYPATAEVAAWFGLQESDLQPAKKTSSSCCCGDGGCC